MVGERKTKEVLLEKFRELQVSLGSDIRSNDGPFDVKFPGLVYEAVFTTPGGGSMEPMETFGVAHRLLHSEDGKYWRIGLKNGRLMIDRASPDKREARAVELLREIRDLATELQLWPTYIDTKTGSYFPEDIALMPGVLMSAPSEVIYVQLSNYGDAFTAEAEKERLGIGEEYGDAPKPPKITAGKSMSLGDGSGDNASITVSRMPRPGEAPLCDRCGAAMVKQDKASEGVAEFDAGMRWVVLNCAWDCTPCQMSKLVVPLDGIPEIVLNDPDILENRKVFEEFRAKIAEEFGRF